MNHPPPSAASTNTPPIQARLLLADDNELVCRQLKACLEADPNVRVETTNDGKEALGLLKQNYYSIFLTDLEMPHVDGLQLIREINKLGLPVNSIVVTGHGSVDNAVEAMKAGAYDFFTKPINLDRLRIVVKRILAERALRDEVVYLREQLQMRETFRNLLSKNAEMNRILELINCIAPTTSTVLITGETGTGKEVLARAIHQASSATRPGPLVAVHCAALPENLLESELFGHEKGSFTGAIGQRKGRFEQAHKGTLFLDEIGEVPLSMQVKLLRVLQERTFERVGGSQPVEIDVRVIAATNRSLAQMVKKGTFREDLYYRINVVRIEVPPLRDRPEDIPLLVEHFCEKFTRPGEAPKQFSGEAMELLWKHTWPGNVRELENVVERACVTTPGPVIDARHLAGDLTSQLNTRSALRIDLSKPLPDLLHELTCDVEKRYIRKALQKTHGHVGRCAEICGMSRRSITAKLAEYGIRRAEMQETEEV
ncbi:MAG: sigma-54 dependent transcriptional regulator [Gemmataceae bacterium]